MPKGVAGALCGLLTAVLVSAASADGRGATALDRYVAAPEASYRYKLLSTETGDTYTANVLAELRRFDSSRLGFTIRLFMRLSPGNMRSIGHLSRHRSHGRAGELERMTRRRLC